jgi:hypothetical protein
VNRNEAAVQRQDDSRSGVLMQARVPEIPRKKSISNPYEEGLELRGTRRHQY